MVYEVSLGRAAQSGLDLVPKRDCQAVAKAISRLEDDPRPKRVKRLGGSGLWRIRVGQYRIVYAIDDDARSVTVVKVARRKEDTYRGL